MSDIAIETPETATDIGQKFIRHNREERAASDAALIFDHTRTQKHVEFLKDEALPKLLVTYGCGIFRPFQLWCIGCEADAIFAYADLLEGFRESIPAFRYRLLASDCDLLRMQAVQTRLEGAGGPIRPGGEILLKLEFLEIWNLAIRETRDVIVCGQTLEAMTCGSPEPVLTDLCNLLFPGRFLVGDENLLGLDDKLPLSQVSRHIFRRTG